MIFHVGFSQQYWTSPVVHSPLLGSVKGHPGHYK